MLRPRLVKASFCFFENCHRIMQDLKIKIYKMKQQKDIISTVNFNHFPPNKSVLVPLTKSVHIPSLDPPAVLTGLLGIFSSYYLGIQWYFSRKKIVVLIFQQIFVDFMSEKTPKEPMLLVYRYFLLFSFPIF